MKFSAEQINATHEVSASEIRIRPATETDIHNINRIIEAAVMAWALPQRVKRLSLQIYRYNHQDFVHLGMVVAENCRQQILGVAAWEEADPLDAPEGHRALLLYGLYVEPSHHRQGIGRRLFNTAEAAVLAHDCHGIVVKAQQDATAFFESMGMCSLPVADPLRHYAHRYWKPARQPDARATS